MSFSLVTLSVYKVPFTNAPWNVIKNQAETLKGAATSLMEELVNESKSLGFSGRLKLYSIPRAKQFYIDAERGKVD